MCHNTTNVAIIHAAACALLPGYEGISAGAIGEQTKRVYNALKKLNRTWGQEKIKESQATHIEGTTDRWSSPRTALMRR